MSAVNNAAVIGAFEREVIRPQDDRVKPVKAMEPASRLSFVSLSDFEESTIPTRPWLIPGLFLRKQVHMLAAPGGTGKSLLTLQIGVIGATNKEWAGWKVKENRPLRVLIINAEDDLLEMQRRLAAIMHEMRISKADLDDRLIVPEAVDDLVVAELKADTGRMIVTPLGTQIIELIQSREIDLVIVDPFAETFTGNESDNNQIKLAMTIWRDIARKTGCAVYLVHHTPKGSGGMAGNADAARGGSAITNACRVVNTLFSMTDEEAKTYDILPDDRGRYVRFDDAKSNYGVVSKKGRWFEKKSIQLLNGSPADPSDWVGVLVPWEPPSIYGGLTAAQLNEVLDRIDEAASSAEPYSKDPRGSKAAHKLLIACGLSEQAAGSLIKSWLKNGTLKTFTYEKPNRQTSDGGLKVNAENRPGNVA